MLKKIAIGLAVITAFSITAVFAGANGQNIAPKAENVSIKTASEIKATGNIPVYDANGDAVRAIVIAQPNKGEIEFKNGTEFTYTPFPGESGKDEFTCVFTDSKGGVGNYITGSILIEPQVKTIYSDMINNPSHYSAIKLLEKDIMTSQKIGNNYYFEPNREVTQGEFLLMVLSAIGEKNYSPCVNTKLSNDNKIPIYLKPAVARAKELKIILKNSFEPNEKLTRAQAVVFVDRASQIPNVHSYALNYADMSQIPKYASQSYINLEAYNMLDLYSNKALPNKILTRDTAADMIWQLYKLNISGNVK